MICTEQTIGYRPVQSTKKKKEKCKIKKDKKLLHPVLAQDNIDNVLSEIYLHSLVNVVSFCVSGLGMFRVLRKRGMLHVCKQSRKTITLDWITIQCSNVSVLIGRNQL